jgi:pimeloyl-ACP methyl ester carboxylesterase
VAEYVAALPGPAILLGHDAGALVVLAAAGRERPAALVLLAPVAPGSRHARRLVRAPRSVLALLRGRPVAPPTGAAAAAWLDLPGRAAAGIRAALGPEDAAAVRDVAWGRFRARPAPAGVPALLVSGDRDRLLPPAEAAALARAVGAERRVLDGAGHWVLAGPAWQAAVAVVHRWLVQRLGEPLLELYADALADREAEDEGAE